MSETTNDEVIINFDSITDAIKDIKGNSNNNISLVKEIAIRLYANSNFNGEHPRPTVQLAQDAIKRAIILATELSKF